MLYGIVRRCLTDNSHRMKDVEGARIPIDQEQSSERNCSAFLRFGLWFVCCWTIPMLDIQQRQMKVDSFIFIVQFDEFVSATHRLSGGSKCIDTTHKFIQQLVCQKVN